MLSLFMDGDIKAGKKLDHRCTAGERHGQDSRPGSVSVDGHGRRRTVSRRSRTEAGGRRPGAGLGQRHFPQPHRSLPIAVFYPGRTPSNQRGPSSGWLLACPERNRGLLKHRSDDGTPLCENILACKGPTLGSGTESLPSPARVGPHPPGCIPVVPSPSFPKCPSSPGRVERAHPFP